MPGYDIERFVDLTQSEKSELVCSICHNILRCPVVTNCCLQSFCNDCINELIQTNKTCPYDSNSLTTDQLSRAPRVVMNLLGKLRIRCDFSANGCNQVIVLEVFSNHLQQCQYNNVNKKCEKCFCRNIKANHDCVEYLLDTNNKITIEANQLRISYEESLAMNTNISTELNHLKRRYEDVVKKVGTDGSDATHFNADSFQQMKELKKEDNCLQTTAEITNKTQSNRLASFSKTSHEMKSEEKLLYSSEDAPDIYKIKLIDSNASIRCGLKSNNECYYALIVSSDSISLAKDGTILFVWPFRHIRRYGYTENSFTLEAGRKSVSGDGLFCFITKHGNSIFQSVATHITRIDASRNLN